MTRDRSLSLKLLFSQVMAEPPEKRESFARQLCKDDRHLFSELMHLLRSPEQPTVELGTVPELCIEHQSTVFSVNEILLNRFRIVRFLGRGGMGEVYEADDAETGRIALKTILRDFGNHPDILARFRQEVQCARKATGTNVCRIHEIFFLPTTSRYPGPAFLTMEFLDGMTLYDRITSDPPISLDEAETIAVQICRGLQTIHDAEIVHRDLKSRNIMLAQRKGRTEAVLMDFGLARENFKNMAAAVGKTSGTIPGSVVGTPEYMAPEQFESGPLTPATDLYALGVVLYEIATGKLPFQGSTPLAAAVGRARPSVPPSAIRPGLAPCWDRTIEKCLCYKAEERFQTANEVAESLTLQTPDVRSRKNIIGRHRVAVLGLGLLCLAVVALVLWYGFSPSRVVPPAASQGWYEKGLAALREGTYLKATSALQMAIEVDRGFVLAHVRLADAWNELDFWGKAKDEMLEASALGSTEKLSDLDRMYVEAVRHTIVREFKSALHDYQSIFDKLPRKSKADGYIDLGRAYEKAGNTDAAISAYSSAASLVPQDPASFVRLGVLESRRKRTAQAEAAFGRAMSLYRAGSNLEGTAEIEFQRGNDANTQLKLTAARTFLGDSLQAARAIPSIQLEVRALTRLSVTEYLNHNTDESIRYANEAISLAQENGLEYWTIDGLIRLGNAYISQGDYAEADGRLGRALSLAQRSQHPRLVALAQLSLAQVRERQNRPKEVVELAQGAFAYYHSIGFASESIDALTHIVRAQRDESNDQAALKSSLDLLAFAEKLGRPAANMRAEGTLGSVLLDLERYPEARDHLEKAVLLSREINVEIEYHLLQFADVLWRTGDYQTARSTLAAIPPASKQRSDIASGVREVTSGMLLSQRRYSEASALARHALGEKTNTEPAFYERLVCDAETYSGSPIRAQQSCRRALKIAEANSDRSAIAAVSLSMANAYLASHLTAEAVPFAQSAHDFFAKSGRKESELFSLLALAKIAVAQKDLVRKRDFSQSAQDILSGFEHTYSTQELRLYLSRPDLRYACSELQTMKK